MLTMEEMISCVRREIQMRERVYPKWVANGKMTQEKADREIFCMESVLKYMSNDIHAVICDGYARISKCGAVIASKERAYVEYMANEGDEIIRVTIVRAE